MNIISQIEAEHMAEIESKRKIPEFSPGDTVRVNVRVTEGARTRIQAYEGVCIARSGGGLHENFTVRKISYGEGVERTFPIYSPMIAGVEIVRRGKVRRAKLYYLRDRRGKSARIAEASNVRAKRLNEEQKELEIQSKSVKKSVKKEVDADQREEDLKSGEIQSETLEENVVQNGVAESENEQNKQSDKNPKTSDKGAGQESASE